MNAVSKSSKTFKKSGVLFKIEEHMHSVGHSERSGAVVEPYLSTQWFVKMQPLGRRSNRTSKGQRIKLILFQTALKTPICAGWKIYVTGVFRVSFGGDIASLLGIIKKQAKSMLDKEAPADIENWRQEEDVLDTWFSSALMAILNNGMARYRSRRL